MTDEPAKDCEGEPIPIGTRVNVAGEVAGNVGDTIMIRPPGSPRGWSFSVPSSCVKKSEYQPQPPYNE